MSHSRLVLIYVVTAVVMSAQTIPPKHIKSDVDTSKERIAALNSTSKEIEKDLTLWKQLYLWGVFVTIVIGALTGIAQYFVGDAEGRVATVQKDINLEKDRLLASELGERDNQTEAIKSQAASDKQESDQKIAGLNHQTATLQSETEKSRSATEELRKSNEEAAERLESEQKKRLQLAASLLPRECSNPLHIADALKGEVGFSARIEFLDESEPRDLAEQLNFIFRQAGWQDVRALPLHHSLFDGVAIGTGIVFPPQFAPGTPPQEVTKFFDQQRATKELAEKIAKLLTDSDVAAKSGPIGSNVSVRTVVVQIGRKPNEELIKALEELGGKTPAPKPFGNITVTGPQRLSFSPDQIIPER